MGGFFVIGLIYWFVGTFSKYILIYKSIKELIKINLKTILKTHSQAIRPLKSPQETAHKYN